MRRDFFVTNSSVTSRIAGVVAGALLPMSPLWAQVAPPAASGPAPLRLDGARSGAGGVVAAPAVTASGVNLDWLLRLKSGQISPEAAWQQGLLTPSNTASVLWSPELLGEAHKPLRLRLAGLLAERAPEVLGPRTAASGELKRLAGDYFRSQKDERAVAFLEAALEEWLQERQAKQKSWTVGDLAGAKSAEPVWVRPLANLAMFYSETGQFLKSAQTWSRAREFSTHPAWLADALVEAARVYLKGGDAAKAKETYAQVPQYRQAWYTGLALHDQALALIKQGQHSEARALLQQPIEGEGADQVRVGLLSLLSASYKMTEEVPEARRAAQEALSRYKRIVAPRLKVGLEYQVKRAQDVLEWAEKATPANPTVPDGAARNG